MTPTDLRRIREERGLTQDEVAIGAGVNVRTISRLEKGESVRPDTVKAVCAFYGIPYQGMVDIEIVAPEHLVAHPSTVRLLKAAEGLPQIRYLVRQDAQGYARYLRRLAGERRFGAIRDRFDPTLSKFLGAWWLIGVLFMGLGWKIHTETGQASVLVATLGVTVLTLLLTREIWLSVQQTQDAMHRPQDRLDIGFAIAEDAIWKLELQETAVRIERIDLDRCRSRTVERHGDFATYTVATRDRLVTIEPVPDHAGVAALIERVRPHDQVRTIPLPQLEAA